MKSNKIGGTNKLMFIIIMILLIIALGVGAFALFTSYRMSLIPSMTFEDMLAHTTKDKENQMGVVILSNLSPNDRIPATVMGAKLVRTLR